MPGPRPKPAGTLRRRNAPESWIVLPAGGCTLAAPTWPLEPKATAAEARLWKGLWKLPVAAWWHEQQISPFVVGRYVRLAISKPALAVVSALERDLALTPAGVARLRLVVEELEETKPAKPSRYRHIEEP